MKKTTNNLAFIFYFSGIILYSIRVFYWIDFGYLPLFLIMFGNLFMWINDDYKKRIF